MLCSGRFFHFGVFLRAGSNFFWLVSALLSAALVPVTVVVSRLPWASRRRGGDQYFRLVMPLDRSMTWLLDRVYALWSGLCLVGPSSLTSIIPCGNLYLVALVEAHPCI